MFSNTGLNFPDISFCFIRVIVAENCFWPDFLYRKTFAEFQKFGAKIFQKIIQFLLVGITQSILPLSTESN